jgi:MFS family permease
MNFEKKTFWGKIYPWIVWLVAAGFFFYKYLVQVSPSVMTQDLMRTFEVNGAGLGNLSAFYFYAYLCMQIPVGMMLDKYSPRLLTTAAIMVCSISTLLFAQTHTLWSACMTRALMGAGAAFAAVSCFKLAALWFAPKRFALVSGLFMTAAMLGAIGGQMPLSVLVQREGWREALEIVGGIGIILGVVYWIVVRDKPVSTTVHQPAHPPVFQSLLYILKNKQAWLLSFYSGLAFAPVSVFGGLWGVPFLETAHQLSQTQAALAASSIFIGFAIGAPLLGWLSDHMGRRKPILFLGTGLAFCCLTLVLYTVSLPLMLIMVLLGLFGFGASGFFTSFAMIRELFPLVLVATVLGIMNTFDSVCEALFEPFVGALLDMTWGGMAQNGVHLFSLTGYHIALCVLPLSLLLALITLFFIQETFCHTFEERT